MHGLSKKDDPGCRGVASCAVLPMACRYRHETHGVQVPWLPWSVREPSRRSGSPREGLAQVTLNERGNTAGCNTNEPASASLYGKCACADRIVCAGRLAEGGNERTYELSSSTGVGGVHAVKVS
jgi:hypothetical protein